MPKKLRPNEKKHAIRKVIGVELHFTAGENVEDGYQEGAISYFLSPRPRYKIGLKIFHQSVIARILV